MQTDFDIFLSEAIKEVFKEHDGHKYFHALITSVAENSLPSHWMMWAFPLHTQTMWEASLNKVSDLQYYHTIFFFIKLARKLEIQNVQVSGVIKSIYESGYHRIIQVGGDLHDHRVQPLTWH